MNAEHSADLVNALKHKLQMLQDLNTLLIGFHFVFFGKLWILLMNLMGNTEGLCLYLGTQEHLLYFIHCCKHESWITTAKYLMDDVPVLLSSINIKNVLATVFTSLPADFAESIKWVAEIRRKEDGAQGLSEEEKQRLSIKEEVLKRMQETDLYKHVTDILSSEKLGCQIKQTLGHRDTLPNIAATVCCKGAEILTGKSGSSDRFCCRETCVRCYRATNGDKPATVVSGTVVNGNGEHGVDMLVPLSSQTDPSCCNLGPCDDTGMHPASNDVLTALLLALPPDTWSGIKDENTLEEVSGLVSTQNLHPLLQEEILHLRSQLLMLKKCKDKKLEDDLGSGSVGTSHGLNSLRDTKQYYLRDQVFRAVL